jgi:hypothetical protein
VTALTGARRDRARERSLKRRLLGQFMPKRLAECLPMAQSGHCQRAERCLLSYGLLGFGHQETLTFYFEEFL